MRAAVLAAALLAASITAGCVTPSIPIPPPDPARMTFDLDTTTSAGTARFTYPPTDDYDDAVVYIYNRDQGTGIIVDARADGSVGPSQPFAAAAGNQVVVTFQVGDVSTSSCIRLQQGAQDANNYCD